MEMTGFGSEAHMFDSKRVLAEFEAVFEAESVGLAPMVTETEAAEVKDDADGVGNEQKTTGELGDQNSDNLWPDTEEGRAAFVKDVEAFYKGNNLVFRRHKFYKEELNLLKLWNAVIDLGGYEKVTSCKLWKHVGELFNPPKTCTTASRIFRHYYEKALLAYEKHKKPDLQPPPSVPSLVEPISVVSPDKSSSPAPKSDNQPKTSGSLKRKRPSATECGDGVELQFGTMLFDIGAPADNVTVKVKKTDNSYEVYALIPGFLPREVKVESDPEGLFVVISGEPNVLDDPWGVASFKKVVLFPSKIDPSKTSAVITERVQVYVCAPFEISDESK